ncbi:hypothetical protein M3231_00960 [Neobacillus mesonae]|nr:hypothetical protein [Neobacillus mesonae]
MGILKRLSALFGTNNSKPNQRRTSAVPEFVYSINLPENLGIVTSVQHLDRLTVRLEAALNDTYMNQVRDRVMAKHSFTSEKYDWMLLELKRYFILCSILKNVPMYSNDTDIIWHEMLMFTRDYEDFCRNFTGEFIHHQPHTSQPSESERGTERAWYDLIYSRLFVIHPENEQLSHPFFKQHLEQEFLRKIEQNPNDELIKARLRITDDLDVKQLQEEMLLTLSHQIREAHLHMDDLLEQQEKKDNRNAAPGLLRNSAGLDPVLSILLLSSASYHLFEESPLHEEELRKAQDTSGCGAYYANSSPGNHDRTDSHHSNDVSPSDTSGGDSSSGGSSCSSSSCGGGCSS